MIPSEMPKAFEQRREITPYLLVKKAEEVALEVGLVFWESKLGVSYDLWSAKFLAEVNWR